MTDYLYPCGFAAIGFQIIDNEHAGRVENYFSTETVMLKSGVTQRHAFTVDRPIRIDLIAAMGPCCITKVQMGINTIPTGMHARLVMVKQTVTPGYQVQIEFECRPELFMLRDDNASTSESR